MTRCVLLPLLLLHTLLPGCSLKVDEVILSEPSGARIYWGNSESELQFSSFMTPHSRSIRGFKLEPRCYQIAKSGYHLSEVICRPEEEYRLLQLRLKPLKTTITSEPSGAEIYWGPSAEQLKKTLHLTPWVEKNVRLGASWKDWSFQVKKEGYHDSEIVFRPQSEADRGVHFVLKPLE
jgi:hypothetical protein